MWPIDKAKDLVLMSVLIVNYCFHFRHFTPWFIQSTWSENTAV